MPDYTRGKIYTITNSINDIIYVGSTTQSTLAQRMAGHRCDAKRMDTMFYKAFNALDPENFTILLYSLFPCASKDELLAEEYRVMYDFTSNGVEVYNKMMVGKLWKKIIPRDPAAPRAPTGHHTCSDEGRKNISESKKGSKNGLFSHGSVGLNTTKGYQTWSYAYQKDNVPIRKAFSVNKYGFWNAKQMAKNIRASVYPDYVESFSDAIDDMMCIDIC
jgi:hypothetical protein